MTIRLFFVLVIVLAALYGVSAATAEASIHWCRTC
jgi:hypothetical protein